jgi:predicted DsbA family dithiol-disulfide isomerase
MLDRMTLEGVNMATDTRPVIEMYSDIHCPWAYMALYRLRQVWPEYRARVRIDFRSLSLELRNQRPTPKSFLDTEILLMAKQEPDLPIWPWRGRESEYVPTLLPAFEAEKAAFQQGEEAGWEYAWRVRHAFFGESRTICMRFVLADIAQEAGLDVDRFLADWDSGLLREPVIHESTHGWETLQVEASPSFVLADGTQITNPAADRVTWGAHGTIKHLEPANCPDGDCLRVYRDMLERAADRADALGPGD